MPAIPIETTQLALKDIARRVERGERIVLTRDGKPVAEVVPPRPTRGIDVEAGRAFLASHGAVGIVAGIPSDFDEPLPEDILVQPLP